MRTLLLLTTTLHFNYGKISNWQNIKKSQNVMTMIVVIAYSFSPKNVLKTSQSDIRCVTSLKRPQDVNLIIIHQIGFQGIFSIFPDSKCIPETVVPN